MMLLHSDLKGLTFILSHGITMKCVLLKQACRKAECSLKRDKLHISYEMLNDTLSRYRHTVKAAKSDLISRTAHCPKVLFSKINTVLNLTIAPLTDSTSNTCKEFLNFFLRKIKLIREDIVSSNIVLAAPKSSSCIFDCSDLVSLPVLAAHEIVIYSAGSYSSSIFKRFVCNYGP